jgi:hypothetical protein
LEPDREGPAHFAFFRGGGDGEKLVDMFQTLELGLKPVKTYEIDDGFFDEFRSEGEST